MVKRLALVTLLILPAVPAAAQSRSAEAMYIDALAKERAVRAALIEDRTAAAMLKAVRSVAADYEAIVRRYPTSGYCDNALWNAAQLLRAAYEQFGEIGDRDAAVRLLKMLASEYPHSRYATQAPEAATAVMQVAPPRRDHIATIRDIRRTVLDEAVRVTIELDAEVSFYEERLADPDRVFVDLSPTRVPSELLERTMRFDGDASPVRQIRLGRHPNNKVRVVLETAEVGSYSVYALYDPYRLVIDCVPFGAVAKAAVPASSSAPSTPAVLPARQAAVASGRVVSPPVAAGLPAEEQRSDGEAAASVAALPHTPTPPLPVAPPSRNLTGGFSIARQLGLSVSRIVIDPGHGGHDPGAKGRGLTEAELVLDVALRLEKLLAAVPEVQVILTRRTDQFVPLEERTAIANKEGADLFLSIHANASNNIRANGVETYFLNFATNLSAASVAARENAASGKAMGALPDFVKSIALNNKLDESRDLATYVQRALIEELRPVHSEVKDLGVKQAPFVVLIGAAMPSVLTEVSFLTNAVEAKLLRGAAYRQHIAEGLFNAVQRYQSSLRRVDEVAEP